MHQPHQRLRLRSRVPPTRLCEQDIDLYISTFNMGLPLPPRPPGVRYALLIHDLFQITLKNYHANRLKALVYRISDYLSIAYALRVADRVWTLRSTAPTRLCGCFPGRRESPGAAQPGRRLRRRTRRPLGTRPAATLLAAGGYPRTAQERALVRQCLDPGARPGARRAAAGAGRQPRPPARGTTRLARPARARRARRRRTARAVPPGRAALATVLRGRLPACRWSRR